MKTLNILILINLKIALSSIIDPLCIIGNKKMMEVVQCCSLPNIFDIIMSKYDDNCSRFQHSKTGIFLWNSDILCLIECILYQNNALENGRFTTFDKMKPFFPRTMTTEEQELNIYYEPAFDKCIYNLKTIQDKSESFENQYMVTKKENRTDCNPSFYIEFMLQCVSLDIAWDCPEEFWDTRNREICDELRPIIRSCPPP